MTLMEEINEHIDYLGATLRLEASEDATDKHSFVQGVNQTITAIKELIRSYDHPYED